MGLHQSDPELNVRASARHKTEVNTCCRPLSWSNRLESACKGFEGPQSAPPPTSVGRAMRDDGKGEMDCRVAELASRAQKEKKKKSIITIK